LALIVASLNRYCSHPGIDAGDIHAVFAYIMMFVGGLDYVPQLTKQRDCLQNIARRLADGPQQVDKSRQSSPEMAALADREASTFMCAAAPSAVPAGTKQSV
jgi:hypothetical protein